MDYLARLKANVAEWNEWRKSNSDAHPDLTRADLAGVNLAGANLAGAILIEADLAGANLAGTFLAGAALVKADLAGANLNTASLREADLRQAYLIEADLRSVNLRRAILIGANLRGAHLNKADLRGADLTNAIFSNTIIVNVDLRGVKGLDAIRHLGPSSLALDTVIRSNGEIPEALLRGVGVPEPFITNIKALTNAMAPIQFHSCFVSYSSNDEIFAERLHADLQVRGIRCWFAPEDLKTGDRFRDRIEESIHVYDKFLLLLSEHSVKSAWVRREVEAALDREDRERCDVLFPIRLDDAVMNATDSWAAEVRRSRQIADFRGWQDPDGYLKAFDRLVLHLTTTQEVGRRRQQTT